METLSKKKYIPPTVEIDQIALEGNIAMQSPAVNINMNDWDTPDEVVTPDTGDIYLAI
jgi:hypothetical protein